MISNIRSRVREPSLIKRDIKFLFQRIFRGWDDSDTWSLDYTTAKFLIPRLNRLRDLRAGYPSRLDFDNEDRDPNNYNKESDEEWGTILNKMITAFTIVVEETVGLDKFRLFSEEERSKQREEGLDLFREYFNDLWW